jgi:DNA-directed RNA polymerase subunit beta'
LKPRISLLDKKGEVINLPNGLPANYYLSVDTVLTAEDGQDVKAGDIIARIPRETSKTRDITGGLPRVAELFEARMPKDFAIITEIDGYVEFGKDYKSKRRIIVRPSDADQEASEYLFRKVILFVRVIRC